MDKKEIVAKLTRMVQQYKLNRSKKREEKKFVDETSQPLLSFRRKGNKLIVSGDSYSVFWEFNTKWNCLCSKPALIFIKLKVFFLMIMPLFPHTLLYHIGNSGGKERPRAMP